MAAWMSSNNRSPPAATLPPSAAQQAEGGAAQASGEAPGRGAQGNPAHSFMNAPRMELMAMMMGHACYLPLHCKAAPATPHAVGSFLARLLQKGAEAYPCQGQGQVRWSCVFGALFGAMHACDGGRPRNQGGMMRAGRLGMPQLRR